MNNQTNISVSEDDARIFRVRFDGFEGLPTTKSNNNFVSSPEFTCFGHRWHLTVFPGGCAGSAEGKVSIVLYHKSDGSIKAHATLSVKKSAHYDAGMFDFQPFTGSPSNYGRGDANFAGRSTLNGALEDGSLIIEIQMRQTEASSSPNQPFIPENPLCKTILNMFMDEESSDIAFEVGDQPVRNTRKRAKASITFYAHRLILQKCSSILGELCKAGEDQSASIPITDVKPDIFRHLLHYIYGGKLSDGDLKANGKDVIDAADKYGIAGLKLEAEAFFVTTTTITIDNVLDNLLYADSKNCALLKEAAMDFIADNKSEAIAKLSFDVVPSYLMKDLLTSVARGEKEGLDASTDPNDFSTMRVSTLRKMLHEKGLDIDGSRETMISLLEGLN